MPFGDVRAHVVRWCAYAGRIFLSLICLVQAYYILDELFINGELQESSKKEVLSVCAQMDEMMDDTKEEGVTAMKAGGKR